MSVKFQLQPAQFPGDNVIFPEAFIKGGEEFHIDEGSPISFTCVLCRDSKQTTKHKNKKSIKKDCSAVLKQNLLKLVTTSFS